MRRVWTLAAALAAAASFALGAFPIAVVLCVVAVALHWGRAGRAEEGADSGLSLVGAGDGAEAVSSGESACSDDGGSDGGGDGCGGDGGGD